MERLWKAAAKRAEIRAYRIDEVAECAQRALLTTLRKELPRSFLREVERCLSGRQVFIPGTSDAPALLEELQSRVQEGRLREPLIEYAILAAEAGLHGERALRKALQRLAVDELGRRRRQTDEHYLRRSWRGTPSALKRVAAGFDGIDLALVARTLAGPKDATKTGRPVPKDALDDGVPLLGVGP